MADTMRPAVAEGLRQRLTAIVQRGHLRRHGTPRTLALAAALVLLLVALHWSAARAVEGEPGPVHHLGYPSILLAAYLFGLRGAVLAAVAATLISGPIPVLVQPDPSGWSVEEADALRAGMFILVAGVTGVLFDHLRTALDGWRSTALRVTQRERDGMVALARGAEAKDTDTGEHILRVQLLSERLALAVSMDEAEAANLGWAAMLHDIGKLRVPDSILTKPAPLTREEGALVRMHTVWGAEILAEGEAFETARVVARWHHEDFDGSGYPDRLRGEDIPLPARIVRIADAFDAMTHSRRYQPARGLEWSMDELARCAGRQFDPELVRLFRELLAADRAFLDAVVAPGPGKPAPHAAARAFPPEHLPAPR